MKTIMNRNSKYLGEMSFCSKLIIHTHIADQMLYRAIKVVGNYCCTYCNRSMYQLYITSCDIHYKLHCTLKD